MAIFFWSHCSQLLSTLSPLHSDARLSFDIISHSLSLSLLCIQIVTRLTPRRLVRSNLARAGSSKRRSTYLLILTSFFSRTISYTIRQRKHSHVSPHAYKVASSLAPTCIISAHVLTHTFTHINSLSLSLRIRSIYLSTYPFTVSRSPTQMQAQTEMTHDGRTIDRYGRC